MPAPLDPECLFRALRDHDVDYVLIGGLAAVLHGSPAMTNDADIVPARDGRNLERLAGALRALRARLRVSDTPDGVEFDPHPALLQSMATLNLTTRCGDLDLTFSPAALDDFDALSTARRDLRDLGHADKGGRSQRHHPIEGGRRQTEGSRHAADLPHARGGDRSSRLSRLSATPRCRKPPRAPGTANGQPRCREG